MKKIILLLILLIFISGCAEKECKTNEDCTDKTCFTAKCKDYKCVYSAISGCCGNKICEVGETYEDCVVDCPDCDDINDCTDDSFDYHKRECINKPILNVVCCGNGLCEIGETYESCTRDCPNCNDDNECTKDSYDYHGQKCINELIVPCCGNEICDEDVETYSSCSTDCPNCDDNDKLTVDSFNYETQECENTELLIREDFGNYKHVESMYGEEAGEVGQQGIYTEEGEQIGTIKCGLAQYLDQNEMRGTVLVCPYEKREHVENWVKLVKQGSDAMFILEDYKGEKVYADTYADKWVSIIWTHENYAVSVGRDYQQEGSVFPEDIADAYLEKYPNDLS